MNKNVDKKPGKLALTLIYSAIIFLILSLTMVLVAVIFIFLVRIGVFAEINEEPNINAIILLISLTSIVIGTFIAGITSRIPLNPVKKLIYGMQNLANGNFQTRLYLGKSFVAKEIADNFNTMASELDKTEQLRSDFINTFSHELKTPIVSIAGFAKLLKKENLSEEKRKEYLDIIEEESLRLSEMTTKILNMTKLENQEILTDVTSFNLSEQIRNCFLILEEKWTQKRIDIVINIDEYEINGNEDFLKEVWLNIIDNAIKFTSQNGIIEVTITKNEGFINIDFFNSDSFIPPEKTEKVFNKFYQADKSRSSSGNGIGLAVAKRIVELHKGSISARSNSNGTTLSVCLPTE